MAEVNQIKNNAGWQARENLQSTMKSKLLKQKKNIIKLFHKKIQN